MYLVSEAQALKHACMRFGLRLSRITLQGVKDFFDICDLFLGDLMLGDPEKILSPAKVLSNFIQANRGATARATLPTGESASRQQDPAMFAYHCTHVAAYPHRASSHSLRAI